MVSASSPDFAVGLWDRGMPGLFLFCLDDSFSIPLDTPRQYFGYP